jgi:Kef-type K+ transport system membrane component KefB
MLGGDASRIPLAMLVVFGSAKLLAELCERLHQPGIVGEILAGVLIGPGVLGWIAPDEFLGALANLGAMFLLFQVGLHVKSSELMKSGPTAALAATLGVIVQFFLTWGILWLWGTRQLEAIFVAAAMVPTSLGITAQVLASKGLLHARASRIILAAAVIDDVEGLLVLAVVSSLATGKLALLPLALTAAMAIAFTLIAVKWGARSMSRIVPRAHEKLRLGEAQFVLSMVLLFALSLMAVFAGVAAIVGAFLAGLALSESVEPRVKDLSLGVTELLVPFFLVGIGLRVDLGAFSQTAAALLALVLLAVAMISKVAGCGLGAMRLGKRDAMRVGVGMIPRGEVGMVAAQLGLALGVIERTMYSVIVLVAVATTIAAPPLVKLAYAGIAKSPSEDEEVFRIG